MYFLAGIVSCGNIILSVFFVFVWRGISRISFKNVEL